MRPNASTRLLSWYVVASIAFAAACEPTTVNAPAVVTAMNTDLRQPAIRGEEGSGSKIALGGSKKTQHASRHGVERGGHGRR